MIMKKRLNILSVTPLIPFISALLFFFGARYAVITALSEVDMISVTLTSDHADKAKLYYDNSSKSPVFTEKKSSQYQKIPENLKVKLSFRMKAVPLSWLRIDPGIKQGKIRIYKIVIQQTLGRKKVARATEIFKNFSSSFNHNVTLSLKDNFVEVTVTGEDPNLVSINGFLPMPVPLLVYIPILILAFYLYHFISKTPPEKLRSFFLPRRESPSNQASILKPLDGLRGFAAMLVVAEHTLPAFRGAGHSGVLIFFALSGFLLTRSFVHQPEKLCKTDFLIQYGQRRLERILPMYYFYLFIVFGMSLRLNAFILHAFFMEGKGHLWTIPQEMVFYALFPVLTLIHHKVFKNNLYAMVLFLPFVIYFWRGWITVDNFYLFGELDKKLPVLIPIFLFGSFFSYILFGIWNRPGRRWQPPESILYLLIIIATLIILMFLFFSNAYLLGHSRIYSIKYEIRFGFCAGLLIFIVSSTGNNLLTRLLSNSLLCSLGVVSYSLYLIHPLVINLVKMAHPTRVGYFIAVLLISYIFSCVTYRFIEYPWFVKKK